MRKLFQTFLLCLTLALAALFGGAAWAATTANGYFTYDPAKEGMRDLREMLPIEGCNVPGGLVRITDRDEPGSAAFWCGPPPHCLAEGTHPVDSCRYVPFCRREPRGNPNGIPGANGCRDPQDLICVSSGEHPEGGRCLKTCWDGSRIPFSQLCPPRCWEETDKDGNSYEVCVQEDEIPDDPPPKEDPKPDPTCPDGTPVPSNGQCATNKKPCSGGTIPYEACEFTWGNTQHGGSVFVNSSTSTPGTLSGQCNDGSWENIQALCNKCPDGSVPVNGQCPQKPCPGGTIPYEACEFTWGNTPHGGSVYVNSSNGVHGVLQAQCNNGSWENVAASCNPVCPDGRPPRADGTCPPTTCPDGSPMPASGVCGGCEGQQVTWNVGSNYCSGYFPTSQETQAHYVTNSNPAYTGQANFSCRGGFPALEWGTCDVVDPCITNPAACQPPPPIEYCPDGTVKPATGCPPPPPVEYCPDGSVKTMAGCPLPPPVSITIYSVYRSVNGEHVRFDDHGACGQINAIFTSPTEWVLDRSGGNIPLCHIPTPCAATVDIFPGWPSSGPQSGPVPSSLTIISDGDPYCMNGL